MPNLYCSVIDLKAAANIRGTLDDTLILDTIEDVSRQIDLECGRHFYEQTRTLYFDGVRSGGLVVSDLLAVDSIHGDSGHNRNYSSTFSSTGYELLPANALYGSPPRPYDEIMTTPNATDSFPMIARGVKVTGSWGYYNVTMSGGTIPTALDATSTGVVVSDGTRVHPGHTFKADAEQFYVNSMEGTTAYVERGVNGTTPATHAASATFGIYTYPVIRRATVLQTARILARHEAALGVVGGGDVGQIRLSAALDPDVKKLLERFVIPVVR